MCSLPTVRFSGVKCLACRQVDEFFISSLLLPDGEPVLVRLNILPFLDIGGSLSIGLQLDRMLLVRASHISCTSLHMFWYLKYSENQKY